MLSTIIVANPTILLGVAGAIGAGIRGYWSFHKKKQTKKKIKFDWKNYGDTIIQGAATGYGIGYITLVNPVAYYGMIGVAGLAGAGLSSYADKFKLEILPWIVRLVARNKKK